MLRPRDSNYEPDLASTSRISTLEIIQTSKDTTNTFKPVAGTLDESYTLNLTDTGHVLIQAATSTGVLRGLETFSQLFFKHSSGTSWYTTRAPLTITDKPKFAHRGLLLDVSRHFYPLEDIKRTIDGLAMNKMNVLHLHITDTQSWPLEIPALPRLTKYHAYGADLVYTPSDIAHLYEYGIHRGVQIIMEIDMPSHVGIDKAYPNISVAYAKKPFEYYCSQPPCGSFRLNNSDTNAFVEKLFDDLLPRVSPYSAYFHTGGDEYKANNSLIDPNIRSNDPKVIQPLLQDFLTFTHDRLRRHGLIPFVWEEMIIGWNLTLEKDVVVQTWLGADAIKPITEAGYKVIDSSNDYTYLDCGRGEFIDYPNGPIYQANYPFVDWCSPVKNWRLIYSHDPMAGLSAESAKLVIGGETPLWSETIDGANLDSIVWPRAAAAGEAWWSGSTEPDTGKNRSIIDVRIRLSEQRERMLSRGVKGAPITQLWCDQAESDACSGSILHLDDQDS